ncbi:MAG TPA: DUF1697 domain-containing protein [Bryobacteraceae bacterium]
MPVFVALIRAINVGGTGMLPMPELRVLCEAADFQNVRTYIQSGNVVLESELSEANVKERLEEALTKKLGKKVDVMVRTGPELFALLEKNPFPDAPPAKVAVIFLAGSAPRKSEIEHLTGVAGEQVRAGKREVYVYYPEGMGRSKLKLPASISTGTARNINTVARLAAMSNARSSIRH